MTGMFTWRPILLVTVANSYRPGITYMISKISTTISSVPLQGFPQRVQHLLQKRHGHDWHVYMEAYFTGNCS